jgi:hypothetical protein
METAIIERYRRRFETSERVRDCVFEWIETSYNLRRRHSSIDYIFPVDFEKINNCPPSRYLLLRFPSRQRRLLLVPCLRVRRFAGLRPAGWNPVCSGIFPLLMSHSRRKMGATGSDVTSGIFLFLFPLSSRPFLTKEKEERGKRKISGRVDITSCCTCRTDRQARQSGRSRWRASGGGDAAAPGRRTPVTRV